jgi:hypothetical protein
MRRALTYIRCGENASHGHVFKKIVKTFQRATETTRTIAPIGGNGSLLFSEELFLGPALTHHNRGPRHRDSLERGEHKLQRSHSFRYTLWRNLHN